MIWPMIGVSASNRPLTSTTARQPILRVVHVPVSVGFRYDTATSDSSTPAPVPDAIAQPVDHAVADVFTRCRSGGGLVDDRDAGATRAEFASAL